MHIEVHNFLKKIVTRGVFEEAEFNSFIDMYRECSEWLYGGGKLRSGGSSRSWTKQPKIVTGGFSSVLYSILASTFTGSVLGRFNEGEREVNWVKNYQS